MFPYKLMEISPHRYLNLWIRLLMGQNISNSGSIREISKGGESHEIRINFSCVIRLNYITAVVMSIVVICCLSCFEFFEVAVTVVRDDRVYQIRWIFGKLPNGLWPPPPPHPVFGKKCCAFVREFGARSAFPLPKKRNIIFGSEMTPPLPHSEVFRKFIEFGPGSHP